jgi:hypothetical protein
MNNGVLEKIEETPAKRPLTGMMAVIDWGGFS